MRKQMEVETAKLVAEVEARYQKQTEQIIRQFAEEKQRLQSEAEQREASLM